MFRYMFRNQQFLPRRMSADDDPDEEGVAQNDDDDERVAYVRRESIPHDLTAVRTRRTLEVVDGVNRLIRHFVILYLMSVAWLLYSMSDVPSCREGKDCVRPLLEIEMDLFIVSTGDHIWRKCRTRVNEKFDADIRVKVPSEVRTKGQPMSAVLYAGPAMENCTNATVEDIQRTTLELGGRVALTELMPVKHRMERSLLTDEKEESFYSGDEMPHWRFGRTPLVLRWMNLDGLRRRAVMMGLPRLGVLDIELYNGSYFKPIVQIDESVALKMHALPMSRNTSKESPLLRFQYRPGNPLISGLRRLVVPQFLEMANAVLPVDQVDEIRWQLGDSRVFRFIVSQIVGFLHVNLAWFAFKEEVGFYVGRTSFKGVAPSTIIWGFLRSLIIFLYLHDSKVGILTSSGAFFKVLADFTKVSRVLRPRIVPQYPYIVFQGTTTTSRDLVEYEEKDRTKEYDGIASRHLGLALGPGILGFALYSLAYDVHASWYSWIINSLADISYFFGFLAMIPQIYVNYKLKSVAHLPVKAFFYKIFSTFIDDVFAFIVAMPLKHRIMTLRDDAVFLVFLLQCFWYNVDKSRVNEFGFVYDQRPPAKDDVTPPSDPPEEHDEPPTDDPSETDEDQ